MRIVKHFIDGDWRPGSSGKWIHVENPATGEVVGQAPEGNEADVEMAVAAAKAAFPGWKAAAPAVRAALLENLADQLERRLDELADIVREELGAPINMVKAWHCEPAVAEARYFAKIAREYAYQTEIPGAKILREPVGVIGCITPWNFPVDQITIKVFPALAAGNCVVLKPSQYTPLTAGFIAEAIRDAGYPNGVFNVVHGQGRAIGNIIAKHPAIQMVSFTGSTEAGKQVGCLAMDNVKKITLELGGKSPAILLPEGDAELAVSTALDDCFINSGQTCNALTRLIVPEDRLAEVETIVQKKAPAYTVGDPADPAVAVGPVIHGHAKERICGHIERGIQEGARIIYQYPGPLPKKGYYVPPTVFSSVNNSMSIAQEEIFGPVLCIIPYRTEHEAVEIANDSPFGLSGGVFGNMEHCLEIAGQMETGGVRINGAGLTLGAPFGGYKQSGLGREYSIHEFEDYLEIKSILIS